MGGALLITRKVDLCVWEGWRNYSFCEEESITGALHERIRLVEENRDSRDLLMGFLAVSGRLMRHQVLTKTLISLEFWIGHIWLGNWAHHVLCSYSSCVEAERQALLETQSMQAALCWHYFTGTNC